MSSTNSTPESTHSSNGSNLAELKALSNYLVETESLLSAFWLMSPTMKIIAKDGNILKCNPACKTFLGYESDELIGKKYMQFVHPDDVNKTHTIETVLEDGGVIRKFYNRYLHKDKKTYVTLEWFARQDQHSELVFATALDKTAELELEAARDREQHRLQQTIDLAPIGIFLANSNGMCKYVNPKYTSLTGLTVEESIGSGWKNGVCDEERERVSKEWYDYVENDKDNLPFETFSCYHNKITNDKTYVKIYAHFLDKETIIGYVEILPSYG